MVLHLPLEGLMEAALDHKPGPAQEHARRRRGVGASGGASGGTSGGASGGAGGGALLRQLRAVPQEAIAERQALLRKYAPLLRFPYPKLSAKPRGRAASTVASGVSGHDSGHDELASREEDNAVSLTLERIAADVAPL